MFDGDWHLVLAAYNGGPVACSARSRSRAADDFWSLADLVRYLPRETREYVPLILAAMIVGQRIPRSTASSTRRRSRSLTRR